MAYEGKRRSSNNVLVKWGRPVIKGASSFMPHQSLQNLFHCSGRTEVCWLQWRMLALKCSENIHLCMRLLFELQYNAAFDTKSSRMCRSLNRKYLQLCIQHTIYRGLNIYDNIPQSNSLNVNHSNTTDYQ